MDINKIIEAAAKAAAAPPTTPASAANIWVTSAIHDAAQELNEAGINDQRMAAAITIARLEAQPELTRAQQHTLNILKEFLHD